jgi:hypothetical protein
MAGCHPPSCTAKTGRPCTAGESSSLPYIEQDDLYKHFHLDEPWDSPHNVGLLSKMPATYAPPGRKAKTVPPYHTVLHVFVGKGAAFEDRAGTSLARADFPDGMSNTLLVVEAGEPVPWSKPDDLRYDPDGPLPDLRCLFRDGFRVSFADGSVHWLTRRISETTLRGLITRNGGEKLPSGWEEQPSP